MSQAPVSVVTLISGRGSNMRSIVEAMAGQRIRGRVAAVISNRPNAQGLHYAREQGIPTDVIDHRLYPDRTAFEKDLSVAIDRHRPGLIVLAGFMRILTPAFVDQYLGRMLNIHPSLLPRYPGLSTHQRALDAGDNTHGVSVHFVTAELDGGPVIAQCRVPVLANDTAETLADRVLSEEHRLYPEVVGWFCEGRLQFGTGGIRFDDAPLSAPIQRSYQSTIPA